MPAKTSWLAFCLTIIEETAYFRSRVLISYHLVVRINAARFSRRVAQYQSQKRCDMGVALLAFVYSFNAHTSRLRGS